MADQREDSEGFYEMLWDCPHCDTKGLLGKSQRHCANCGAPQDASKRYFPTPEQQQQVVGHIFVGADLSCPSCSAPQSAKAKNCTQCGSPLDGGAEVRGAVDYSPPIAMAAPATSSVPRKRHLWPFALGGIAAIVFGVWFMFIRTKTGEVTITGHRWETIIPIEEFGNHLHEAWRNEVPASATIPVICSRKQRTTRQVPDGEDCHTERKDKKDGTFEQIKKCTPKTRSEGVDDDWCRYNVLDWAKVRDATSTGSGMSPGVPFEAAAYSTQTAPTLGAFRAGVTRQKLTLDFGPDDSCDVADPIWRKYADGAKAKVELRARSGGVVCDSL